MSIDPKHTISLSGVTAVRSFELVGLGCLSGKWIVNLMVADVVSVLRRHGR
jgi:hypothetical protein